MEEHSQKEMWITGEGDLLATQKPGVFSDLLQAARSLRKELAPDLQVEASDLINELALSLATLPRIEFSGRIRFFEFCRTLIALDLHSRLAIWKARSNVSVIHERELLSGGENSILDMMALAGTLDKMNSVQPRLAKIVELRFFCGLGIAEIASKLSISEATVKREWRLAKLWLYRELPDTESPPENSTPVPSIDESISLRGSVITLELIDPVLLLELTKHPALLQSLDWRTFEKVLAVMLEKLGYTIELQRGTKDGGIDLFAIRKSEEFGLHRYLLQAKRYSKPVGIEPVRELLFLQSHHRITKACLATTSKFTKGAWELADQYQWQLKLTDYEKLVEWLGRSAKRS